MADSNEKHPPTVASSLHSEQSNDILPHEGQEGDTVSNDNNSSSKEEASFELEGDISDDESDEVSLMVVDEKELANAMQEAGISIKVLHRTISCSNLRRVHGAFRVLWCWRHAHPLGKTFYFVLHTRPSSRALPVESGAKQFIQSIDQSMIRLGES